MITALLLPLIWLARVPDPPSQPMRLTLKNGTVYVLKEPPRVSGTRVVFTTRDGRLFSMDQSEIEGIRAAPRPNPTPRRYDSGDSHALGAIARQQRDRKGKAAEVAPRSSAVRRPTPKPRPRSRASNPSDRAAGKELPG